jgi:hypothetical protein
MQDLDRIPDRIRLARQAGINEVVIVEGKRDRQLVVGLELCPESNVFIAGTRAKVIDSARQALSMGLGRLACIVDRDFDDVVDGLTTDVDLRIVAYDNADQEAMLWFSPAFERVLTVLGSEDKLDLYGGAAVLRKTILETLMPIIRLRRANALHGWSIKFDDLDLASKVNLRTLTLSSQSLCDSLWSEDCGASRATLYAVANDDNAPLPQCPETASTLVKGRDALAVTGVALRRLVGNLTKQQSHVDSIEGPIRLSANTSVLQGTSWYSRVRDLLAG